MNKIKELRCPKKLYAEVQDASEARDEDHVFAFTTVDDLKDGIILEYTLTAVLRKTTTTSTVVEPL